MVFFTCSSCGKSLKKNQVERHIHQCRGYQYMTCMDCSKDFWGTEYHQHNKCLTENEKYGGSNYVEKGFKGAKKQEAWINRIQEQIASTRNMNPQLKSLFQHIMKFDNIPRKKAKFMNFLKSNNYKNIAICEEAWEFFENASKINKSQNSTNAQDSSKPTEPEPMDAKVESEIQEEPERKTKKQKKEERRMKQNKIEKKDKRKSGDDDEDGEENVPKKKRKMHNEMNALDNDETKVKRKKKVKQDMEEEGMDQENQDPSGTLDSGSVQEMLSIEVTKKSGAFSWKKAIFHVLKDAPEEGMKVKKLKRKLTAMYVESKGDAALRKTPLEIDALIHKKLNMRNDKYVFVKDRVKIKEMSE
ncbi:hypothetical protein SK128_002819 [Halocaridina rubra]|uniref:Cell growth-regulating nucleolar protein n=1 Tax=Halocaridina rubra TaxID=373956 RepID=A0AAN8WUA1_HALRR